MERKAEVKRQILPEYEPWVDGVLSGNQGVQDDVLMSVMVWRIDAGDLDGALNIARYAVTHKLSLPDQYKRNTACLLAEEFSDMALRDITTAAADDADFTAVSNVLREVSDLTAAEDMPDEVRAKLHKAIGLTLVNTDKPTALENLQRAFSLHDKVGVKKDIEKLDRELKKLAEAAGTS